MNFKVRSNKFDKEIRKECDSFRLMLIDCLNSNKFDQQIRCYNFIRDFEICKENFIKKINKDNTNIKFNIYYD